LTTKTTTTTTTPALHRRVDSTERNQFDLPLAAPLDDQ
jgi:hypothetical protein